MPVNVGRLEEAYPGGSYASPHGRACALGYAALDYLKAVVLVVESQYEIGPLFNFLLPTMHQTLELLSKAVAFKIDDSFDPKKYSHRILDLLRDYSASTPIFQAMLADPRTVELLKGLEKSYLGVRYGECHVSYDGEAWKLFMLRAVALFDELHAKTKVPFLGSHSDAKPTA